VLRFNVIAGPDPAISPVIDELHFAVSKKPGALRTGHQDDASLSPNPQPLPAQ